MDYASVATISKSVSQVMKPWLDGSLFGNPSSVHNKGVYAKEVLSQCVSEVRRIVHAHSNSQVIFTSGGTESNTQALHTLLHGVKDGDVLLTSGIEHPSVKAIIDKHAANGLKTVELSYTDDFKIDMKALDELLENNNVTCASIMMVNNEMGLVVPIKKLISKIKKNNPEALVHVDASQAPLYVSCSVDACNIDLLTLCGQKIYGPQGSGALWVREGLGIEPLFIGGKQQSGLRAGTEPMHQIVGFTQALDDAYKNRDEYGTTMSHLQSYFFDKLTTHDIPYIHNGNSETVPLACNVSFPDCNKDSEYIVSFLNTHGIYVSSRSACMGSVEQESHVLKMFGVNHANQVRFSFGEKITTKDIDYVVSVLVTLAKK